MMGKGQNLQSEHALHMHYICTTYALQIPSIVAASNRLSVTIKLASDTLLLEYRV